jgi:hypothetical protein
MCDPVPFTHDQEAESIACPACFQLVPPLVIDSWCGSPVCLDCATYLRIQAAVAEREAEAARWNAFAFQFSARPRHALES